MPERSLKEAARIWAGKKACIHLQKIIDTEKKTPYFRLSDKRSLTFLKTISLKRGLPLYNLSSGAAAGQLALPPATATAATSATARFKGRYAKSNFGLPLSWIGSWGDFLARGNPWRRRTDSYSSTTLRPHYIPTVYCGRREPSSP